ALAILAWLQTLPEFAVEAVLAWKQQVDLLLAGLTGALRLLTGLGWPMIYAVTAYFHRRRSGTPLLAIRLKPEHCVEVVGLLLPLLYMGWVWAKRSLTLVDAAVLVAIYVAYLFVLSKLPPEEQEGVEELERIPRSIVKSSPLLRNVLIFGLFAGGGALIYFTADPFLGSLMAVATILGVPNFVFIQWVAPFVSEFPEKVSAFYWARTVDRSPMALMNMVSSNINQWTLLTAMLPIVYSFSMGKPSPITFDQTQGLELLMTLGQSLVAMLFLVNMKLAWWEAMFLFALWFIQFLFSPIAPGDEGLGYVSGHIRVWTTWAYFVWAGLEIVRIITGRRELKAFRLFREVWSSRVLKRAV
ncbi:MAG: hypothetical protein H7039_02355, partial [Bryobacteraceae bacterium]|nr:hypothetical protein [Bryobacteraceae bacterium]